MRRQYIIYEYIHVLTSLRRVKLSTGNAYEWGPPSKAYILDSIIEYCARSFKYTVVLSQYKMFNFAILITINHIITGR